MSAPPARSAICGAVRKQSRLGFSWNARYLVADGKDVKIYRSQQECEKNGKCKYVFNMLQSTMEKFGDARNNEVKVTFNDGSKEFKFQIANTLWSSLEDYYSNIHNLATPLNNDNDGDHNLGNEHQNQLEEHVDITEATEICIDIGRSPSAPQKETANDNIAEDIDVAEAEQEQQQEQEEEQQPVIVRDLHALPEPAMDREPKQLAEEEQSVERKTEETELLPVLVGHEWNIRYKEYLDIADESQRRTKIQELLTEFCALCKRHCVAFMESTMTTDSELRKQAFVRDEIEFKVIQSESEYEEIKLVVTNWKLYATAFDGEERKLYTPLSCILEYLNFRIYCKAVCGFISGDNLRFGENISDGTFKCDAAISSLLDVAAKKLNLSTHVCKLDENVTLSTSSNIKIYESESNDFYIGDVVGLFPIDIVHFLKTGSSINIKTKQCITRLHPKLVQGFAAPISSDAFVKPEDDKHDQIASKVIYNLHSNVIPKFTENINNAKVIILDCQHLQSLMDDAGIGLIYIGEIYNLCKIPYALQIIETLMIALTIQQCLMFDEIVESKDEYEAKINYYINCFSNKDDSYELEAAIKQKIMSIITIKYGVLLNNELIHNLPLKFMQQQLRTILSRQSLSLSVPDKYISDDHLHLTDSTSSTNTPSLLPSIQQKFKNLRTENAANLTSTDEQRGQFDSFKRSSLQLVGEIDQHFASHALKFKIMNTICQTYTANITDKSDEETVDYACALYTDCHKIATVVLGKQHRKTVAVQVEICKLSFLTNQPPSFQHAEKLENTLKSVQLVFAKHSLKTVPILNILCETYLSLANYDKAYEYAKQLIFVLDEKKKYDTETYFNAHLQISLIAEKTGDFGVGIRFLNKLYNHLKKNVESKKQKLWENVDVKMLCVCLSRFKLKMCADSKFESMLKKWKAFYENERNKEEIATQAAQHKVRELLIQNLCLNPIHKSNELLRDSADPLQVICWINLIKEFETNFLGIKQ